MPVTRRTIALLCAALLGLSACTGDRDPADSSEQPSSAAPEWNTRPESIAAIGDSITRAFDACSFLADCPEVSWATGSDEDVPSLAQMLLPASATAGTGEAGGTGGERQTAGRVWNEAESGAVMADLPEQARRAAAWDPELVTVLIGANDACTRDLETMTDVPEFRKDFTESLRIIREEAPEAQVYVASVPDLLRLWSEVRDEPQAQQAWRFGICPSMLSDPLGDSEEATERRLAVRERVEEFNAVLAEVCATDDLCRYDEGAVFDYPFTADELSDWDWFHPSRQGQAVLAELAHERITATP
ncbi:SGNH/GDSL hydrolase family protein [Streptomyces sodiiphilus]|uniref:SGNH/GDSL hydrolase family protein n=1 Tax=Streptomyces sodiiphilus TaxID=226217 RepID=A0ABN2NV39_9ACTN